MPSARQSLSLVDELMIWLLIRRPVNVGPHLGAPALGESVGVLDDVAAGRGLHPPGDPVGPGTGAGRGGTAVHDHRLQGAAARHVREQHAVGFGADRAHLAVVVPAPLTLVPGLLQRGLGGLAHLPSGERVRARPAEDGLVARHHVPRGSRVGVQRTRVGSGATQSGPSYGAGVGSVGAPGPVQAPSRTAATRALVADRPALPKPHLGIMRASTRPGKGRDGIVIAAALSQRRPRRGPSTGSGSVNGSFAQGA